MSVNELSSAQLKSIDSQHDSEKIGTSTPPAEIIDSAAERKLVRKLDMYIMPLFFFLYMLCFLDR
jgi:hypothetical protein